MRRDVRRRLMAILLAFGMVFSNVPTNVAYAAEVPSETVAEDAGDAVDITEAGGGDFSGGSRGAFR